MTWDKIDWCFLFAILWLILGALWLAGDIFHDLEQRIVALEQAQGDT